MIMEYSSVKKEGTDEDELVMMCTSCGSTDFNKKLNRIVFSQNILGKSTEIQRINENIVYDPSLSRTSKVICPNKKCKSNSVSDPVRPQMVLFHYNTDKRLGYICYHCKKSVRAFVSK